MTYAPSTLLALRAFLAPHTGLSAGNLGIVGDAAHARRASYHNGKDRMIEFGRLATDYSARIARDRVGLSNAASALDIGNHTGLRALSVWLVARARANAPGTSDIREIILSPDGEHVLRWDRERGYQSTAREGEADSSHLWHTHISWYRDSERRDKVSVFRPFYESEDDGLPGVRVTPVDTPIRSGIFRCMTSTQTIPANGAPRGRLDAGSIRHALGRYALTDLDGRVCYLLHEDGEPSYVAEKTGTFEPWERDSGSNCDDLVADAIAITKASARITFDMEG